MMQFERDRHERQFQLAFNRSAIRGDIIYSLCLGVFGLSAVHRLRELPGTGSAVRLAKWWPGGHIAGSGFSTCKSHQFVCHCKRVLLRPAEARVRITAQRSNCHSPCKPP